MKAESGEEAIEEKFEASKVCCINLKKDAISINIKEHGEAASAEAKYAVSYPEDLVKIINEGGNTKH